MGDFPADNVDAFGKLIADSTTNHLNVASHYPFSPERWRFFVDGTRQFIQYNSVSQYNHATDVHELSPAGGETVTLETTERPRYVVQYEQDGTFAMSASQSLNSGDRIRIGLFTDNEGWFLEHNGDHASDSEVDLVIRRNGSEEARETNELSRPVTDFTRYELRTNWYNVGRQRWAQTFSAAGSQNQQLIGTTSVDGGRGPQIGNLPMRYEVTAASGTSNLTVNAGSIGFVTLGDVESVTRVKSEHFNGDIGSGNTWVPFGYGLRIDPDRDITNVQLTDVQVQEWGGSGDLRVIAQSFDPSKVADSNGNQLTDSDFSTPATLSSQNSVMQETTNIAQFADSSGTVGTSASNPGGWQVGFSSLYSGGQSQNASVTGANRQRKRQISDRDIVVFLAFATDSITDTASADVEYTLEEEW